MSDENRQDKKIKLTDASDNDESDKAQEQNEEKPELNNNKTNVNEDPTSTSDNTLPGVFETDNLTYDVRWDVINWEILPDSKPFEVEQSFAYYVKDYVETGRWEAIWRSHQLECNVLVEVADVQADFQRAKVELVLPFCHQSCNGKEISQQTIEQVLQANKERVSLLELFPVFDESGDLDDTAMALENLRFFYDYIWRMSDENDDGDYIYAQRHLEQRMKMYYDVKNKSVPASVADKYLETMAEYQHKYWQLKLKRVQYDPDSDAEDEDEEGPEIPEADLVEMTELCDELDVLMKTLEKLEDPVMRAIVMRGSAKKDKKHRASEDRHSRPNQEVITHLVADKLTVAMIKSLAIDDDTIIVQHDSLISALNSCYNGDTVLLFPGTYSGEGFYNLNQSIQIKGVGESPTDVVILCQEKVGIFVDCTAYKLHLSNMTFESEIQDSLSFAALDVRSGTTILSSCVFRSLCQPVIVSREGSLVMNKCEIHGFLTPGIKVVPGGTLTLSDSHVHHCGGITTDTENQVGTQSGSNILIEAQADAEGFDQTAVKLHNNKVEGSKGSGICITVHSTNLNPIPEPTNVESNDEVASLLPSGLKWEAKNNMFKDNKKGSVCVIHVGSHHSMDIMDTSL